MAKSADNLLRAYNYEHFWLKHFLADIGRTFRGAGVRPGSPAPDFDLVSTEGDRVSLGELRGEIVLLHFGSGT